MGEKENLTAALQDAMRSGDEVRKRVLRMALTVIKLGEVEKGGPLDDSEIMAVLQKQARAREETIADADKAGRPDLRAEAEAEIAVLEAYLPQALTPEEIERLARQVIAETGAATLADLGKVMQALMPQVRGRADGGEVNRVVRSILQGN